MENVSIESFDKDEWRPPDPPLTVPEIQRGIYPSYKVKSERASKPFSGELEHWSALPALSYFALNAVAMRESMRRITPSSTFHPPPRLTLSDRKKDTWFMELKDPNVSLRKLSRAIPHSYTTKALLDVLMEKDIPVPRAVWFIKCVGANQVRALKRKAYASSSNDSPRQRTHINTKIESNWINEWTNDVIAFVSRVMDSFDAKNGNIKSEDSAGTGEEQDAPQSNASQPSPEQWKKRMVFASKILLHLYNAMLVNQYGLLEWLLKELRESSVLRLPCLVHLVQLFWRPLTSNVFSHQLFKSITSRYSCLEKNGNSAENGSLEQLHMIIEPILLKLASTNEDAFVAPRSWPVVEPFIRNHPAYYRLSERNQSFLVDNPHGPVSWQLHLEAGAILDNFVRPYRVDELMNVLFALNMDTKVLIRAILTWTVRQSTDASIQLCCSLLKKIGTKDSSVSMPECCVDFLFDPHLIHGSQCLGSLVSELLSARLCHLGLYIHKVISSGILYSSGVTRELHLRILNELPFDRLTPSIRAQVEMILRKIQVSIPKADLNPFVDKVWHLFSDKPWTGLQTNTLSINDRKRLAENLVKLYEKILDKLPSDPAIILTSTNLSRFLDVLESVSCASMKPLFRVLSITLESDLSDPSLVSCALRQVHVRLMAFVCSNMIDAFALRLITKLQRTSYDYSGAMRAIGLNHISPSPQSDESQQKISWSSKPDPRESNDNNVFEWVGWDDICALRAVIQTPSIMVELNRVVPLRHTPGVVKTIAGHTPCDQDLVKQLLYRPGSPDVSALLALRGKEQLASPIVAYAQSHVADRTALLQLVTYKAVSIEDLSDSHSENFAMLRFLLLEPANELGFSLDEVETLRFIRNSYLENVSIDRLFALCSSVIPMRFLSRIAHLFPDIYLNRMLPVLKTSPEFLRVIFHTTEQNKKFNDLLIRCTPFNLRYYQGLTVLAFYGKPVEEVVEIVFKAAFSQPEASSALYGLLQYLSYEAKEAIFVRTVNEFLSVGLDSAHLTLLDVYVTLVSALGHSIDGKASWNLEKVPSFLDILVKEATEVSCKPPAIGCNEQWEEVMTLRKVLSLVLRISVIGGLHGVNLPAAALPHLEKLLHIQVFADNFRVRTFIQDSLRLLLRISSSATSSESSASKIGEASMKSNPGSPMSETTIYQSDLSQHFMSSGNVMNDSDLSTGCNSLDGLKLYSKKRNTYSTLPVWVFDMIEDASPTIKRNDGCVDLSYFETYED